MLTGDSAAAAPAVGRAVGADAVRWRLLPEDKVEAVRELRSQYGPVGMLGDGITLPLRWLDPTSMAGHQPCVSTSRRPSAPAARMSSGSG